MNTSQLQPKRRPLQSHAVAEICPDTCEARVCSTAADTFKLAPGEPTSRPQCSKKNFRRFATRTALWLGRLPPAAAARRRERVQAASAVDFSPNGHRNASCWLRLEAYLTSSVPSAAMTVAKMAG